MSELESVRIGKRQNWKVSNSELTSKPVGQSFYGLGALSLSWLKIAGTTAYET